MLDKLNEISANSSQSGDTKTTVDLTAPGVASLVTKRIADDIDAACVTLYDEGHRNHLGASLIGRTCKRELWFGFRWVRKILFDGRKLRLFNRGHREEERFVEWLRAAGFKVWTHDESQPKKEDGTYPQFRISSSGGHFGGSLDGIAEFPPHYNIPEAILLEFKTKGTGSGFNSLVQNGMAVEAQEHFAQTSTYGADSKYRFRFVLYMSINKNDDSIHIELVALDWNLGEQMKLKAEQIILSRTPPPRISNQRTYQRCNYCDFQDICHDGAQIERNCRSCVHAVPVDNAEWFCSHEQNNAVIPSTIIPNGCQLYTPLDCDVT